MTPDRDTAGRQQRKEREFRFRRAEILERAEKLFAAKDFHETTMAEVASSAGFSTGGRFRFFSAKGPLYSFMVMEKGCQLYGGIMATRRESLSGKVDDVLELFFRGAASASDTGTGFHGTNKERALHQEAE